MRVFILMLTSAALGYAEESHPEDFPYYALSQNPNGDYCAGIILTEDLVLLSSKCTDEYYGDDDFKIRVGNVNKNSKSKTYTATQIFAPEKYLEDSRDEDIGFLAVSEKFEFNSNIQPAKQIYKSNGNENVLKKVGIEPHKMGYTVVPTIQSKSCSSKFGVCVMRNSEETMPNFRYLLTSEDGEVYGLPYYFSDREEDSDVFLVVNNYMDMINETIEEYENTK